MNPLSIIEDQDSDGGTLPRFFMSQKKLIAEEQKCRSKKLRKELLLYES